MDVCTDIMYENKDVNWPGPGGSRIQIIKNLNN